MTLPAVNAGAPSTRMCSDGKVRQIPIREILMQRLAALVPKEKHDGQHTTSGVDRQVRHNGIYASAAAASGARAKQKETLQAVASTVCLSLLALCLNTT